MFDEDLFPPVLKYIGNEFDNRSVAGSFQHVPDIIAVPNMTYESVQKEISKMLEAGYKNNYPADARNLKELTFRGRPLIRIEDL